MIGIDNFVSYDEYYEDKENSVSSNRARSFINDCIEWYSDDLDYDVVSVLIIVKKEESYRIIFSKSMDNNIFETYLVRFRDSRSRYFPYNILFYGNV